MEPGVQKLVGEVYDEELAALGVFGTNTLSSLIEAAAAAVGLLGGREDSGLLDGREDKGLLTGCVVFIMIPA